MKNPGQILSAVLSSLSSTAPLLGENILYNNESYTSGIDIITLRDGLHKISLSYPCIKLSEFINLLDSNDITASDFGDNISSAQIARAIREKVASIGDPEIRDFIGSMNIADAAKIFGKSNPMDILLAALVKMSGRKKHEDEHVYHSGIIRIAAAGLTGNEIRFIYGNDGSKILKVGDSEYVLAGNITGIGFGDSTIDISENPDVDLVNAAIKTILGSGPAAIKSKNNSFWE